MSPLITAFQVLELLLDDGLSPYAQWFDGLAPDIAAEVATVAYRLQQGNLSMTNLAAIFSVFKSTIKVDIQAIASVLA